MTRHIRPHNKAPFYKHNLVLQDYQEMANLLGGVKGKFLLSINDTSEMRQAFDQFNIQPVSLTYSVRRDKGTEGKELLISNY